MCDSTDDLDRLRGQLHDAVAACAETLKGWHAWKADIIESAAKALEVGRRELQLAVEEVDRLLLELTRERLRRERQGPDADLR